jgi:hypothetical protein
MSHNDITPSVAAQFDEDDFEAMRGDGVEEYRIRFADGRERTTVITALAYFAQLDPEATVAPA